MPRGGRQPGSGRKPGTKNRRTIEIAVKAAAAGITPLEVMLSTMRECWSRAEATQDADAKLALMSQACEHAASAATYIHPKPATVQVNLNADAEKYVLIGEAEAASSDEWQGQHEEPTLQ